MLSIPVKEFNAAINKILYGAAVSGDLSEYKVVRFELYDNTLKLSSYNKDGFVCTFLEISREDHKAIEVFLYIKNLADITSSFTEGNYKFSFETGLVKLSCKRSRFSLNLVTAGALPEPAAFSMPLDNYKTIADPNKLFKSLKKILPFTEKDTNKHYSNLVHIEKGCVVATDGVVLAVADCDSFEVPPEHLNFASGSISKFLKIVNPKQELHYYIDQSCLAVWSGGTFLTMQRVMESYPLFRQRFEGLYEKIAPFTLKTSELKEELRRLRYLDDVKGTAGVTLDIQPGVFKLSIKGCAGSGSASVESTGISAEITAVFSLPLLLEGCSFFTSERINVKLPREREPILFYEEGYKVYVCPRGLQ